MAYFRLDTTDVFATRIGRIYSARPAAATEMPNGVFGTVGELETGEELIRVLGTPDPKKELAIVAVPEVRYEQDRMADAAIGLYRNAAGKVLRVIPVAVKDTVSLSEDFLAKAKATKSAELAVGDIITISASLVAGQQLDYSAGAPSAGNKYLKITKIFNSHIPVFLGGDGKMFPGVYKMYDLEVFEA